MHDGKAVMWQGDGPGAGEERRTGQACFMHCARWDGVDMAWHGVAGRLDWRPTDGADR